MLTVTTKAATLLKQAKSAQGAKEDAGIRIYAGEVADRPGTVAVGLAVRDVPDAGDQELEQDGLRVFVQSDLVETLDARTLDVQEAAESMELVFR